MIKPYIEHLVIAYPTEISAVQNAVDMLMPWALICAGIWLVWQLLCWVDRLIDRSEAKRIAKAREPQYRTADGEQIKRDVEQLWHHAPNASGAFWEPWRDTVPPAEHVPRHRVRSGSPPVAPFPSHDAQRRRQS